MNYTATYSPDDNKLRLYASERLDPETYQAVQRAGFKWAPKQELFVAPMWTPDREDLLLELAGEIEDEDKSLVERAEERSERFEEYSENRLADAESARQAVAAIADGIPFGQPILVGHHSEKRARKDAEKIRSGMSRAVKMWKQSEYWADRAAGAIRAAKYKERPDVRARRIKGLEADLRKAEKTKRESGTAIAMWARIDDTTAKKTDGSPASARDIAMYIANRSHLSFKFSLADYPRDPPASQYEGDMSLWSALNDDIITAHKARDLAVPRYERSIARLNRWIEHYENRLAYERAMLTEAGGTVADQSRPQVGGAIKSWHFAKGWSYITKVNKVSVTILDKPAYGDRCYRSTVPFDKIKGIMSPAEVNMAKQQRLVQEVAAGNGIIVGFNLLETAPQPAAEPAQAPPAGRTEDAFKAMEASLRAGIKVQAVNQLFPTPRSLADEVVELADIQPGDKILEPEAGTGVLLDAVSGRVPNPERGQITAVEINRALADRLERDFPNVRVICGNFLDASLGSFNKILMNPPFENGDDIKHIERASQLLIPGGRLVAICANGPRQQARLKPLATEWRDLPVDTFKQCGTGVLTALIVIDRAA